MGHLDSKNMSAMVSDSRPIFNIEPCAKADGIQSCPTIPDLLYGCADRMDM